MYLAPYPLKSFSLPLEFQPWARMMMGCSGLKLDEARDSSVSSTI